MSYAEMLGSFPVKLRVPIAHLVDTLKEELAVTRTDFGDLKNVVLELAEAQKRTDQSLERLTEAQKRTDQSLEKLTEAQKRTDEELTLFRRTFTSQIGGLGARWGMQTEESFRQGIRAILQEIGFTTERFLEHDAQGVVFGHADQIELDVVVKNGKVIVVELKSSLGRADTYYFDRKVAYYTQKTGRSVDRKLIVTPYADRSAMEVGLRLGVAICTDINMLGSE